ncbi:HD domain-containing protein [Epilithonimonas ginsengisoli]|uniref:HD domain-containing protein n=1 Tax=Epilithonimonas ginsengisoli TaxID=1245592 RepID=A0ABU4JHN0_9FLAO|nr:MULTISPECIES: HD domain-containing protein [Chryseobacterium group]MBV6880641.1 HD domain-containing protein [Epilithonimonas sp. FP105]MDW8549186.1 HD domain-containing protein [Epilithonimonas ginsengisoli]OAH70401.1 phosphohydrolase [Chryseobacterium sp. FP211-J200]
MELINKTIELVKEKLEGTESGHDWFHIERVWKLSLKIQEKEGGDKLIIELASLLHDIADPKFHNGDETIATKIVTEFLTEQKVDQETIDKVIFIIENMSFKNRNEAPKDLPLELKIVQDADRLDAIGAIGIARTFNFGGYKNNLMYHPDIEPKLTQSKEEYKKSNGTTINHFYEKLLLLKDLLNTKTAKEIAEHRHQFMLQFLDEFYKEWNVTF